MQWFSSLLNAFGKRQRQRDRRKDRERAQEKRKTQKENEREKQALYQQPAFCSNTDIAFIRITGGRVEFDPSSTGRGKSFIVPFVTSHS